MRLEDLKAMNIPELTPIEIEYPIQTTDRFRVPPETDKRLVYFIGINKEQPPKLLYCDSTDELARHYDSKPVDSILSVSIMVREEAVS